MIPQQRMTETELASAMKKLAFAEGHRRGFPRSELLSKAVRMEELMELMLANPGRSAAEYGLMMSLKVDSVRDYIKGARHRGWTIKCSCRGHGSTYTITAEPEGAV